MAKNGNGTVDLSAPKAAVEEILGRIAGYEAGIAAERAKLGAAVESLISAAGGFRGPFQLSSGVYEFRKLTGPGNAGTGYVARPYEMATPR